MHCSCIWRNKMHLENRNWEFSLFFELITDALNCTQNFKYRHFFGIQKILGCDFSWIYINIYTVKNNFSYSKLFKTVTCYKTILDRFFLISIKSCITYRPVWPLNYDLFANAEKSPHMHLIISAGNCDMVVLKWNLPKVLLKLP